MLSKRSRLDEVPSIWEVPPIDIPSLASQPSRGTLANPFRVAVIGEAGVGRRTFVSKLIGRAVHLEEEVGLSIGVEFAHCEVDQVHFSVRCGDGVLEGTDLVLILFDVQSRVSYKRVPDHFRDANRICGAHALPVHWSMLCANKIDVDWEKHKVQPKHVTFHRKKGMPLVPMSARATVGLLDPFALFLSNRAPRMFAKVWFVLFDSDPVVSF